jgi:ammonium transporter Rh
MEIMLNATLAGGVAIGSASDVIVTPWAAMLIGWLGGVLSAIGFQKIGPWLNTKLKLADTCGVNSLHGMPGIFGAIVSAIAIGASSGNGFPADYFPAVGEDKSLSPQFWAQILALIVTLVISMASGAIGGFICSLDFF